MAVLQSPLVRRLAATFVISAAGLAGLSQNEGGAVKKVYPDVIGVSTVCVGHVTTLKVGTVVTQDYCDELLQKDTSIAQAAVKRLVKVPITQNQYDALVDFTFNVGSGNFAKSSLLTDINAGRCVQAGAKFALYNKGGGKVLRGLVNRRAWEERRWTPDCPESTH